ncbi:ATP-binding protein [Kaistella sp.]|uniref:ATP-binding protein n=1 Tax=Kaistella sp. TaxID=2782235 RepID=UPI003C364459
MKHSEAGQKLIKADKIKFPIQDFGIGIDAKYQSKIFEWYFQVPEDHQNGTGLGLAISKNFIEKQGGEIGVESEGNGGSIFWITL